MKDRLGNRELLVFASSVAILFTLIVYGVTQESPSASPVLPAYVIEKTNELLGARNNISEFTHDPDVLSSYLECSEMMGTSNGDACFALIKKGDDLIWVGVVDPDLDIRTPIEIYQHNVSSDRILIALAQAEEGSPILALPENQFSDSENPILTVVIDGVTYDLDRYVDSQKSNGEAVGFEGKLFTFKKFGELIPPPESSSL